MKQQWQIHLERRNWWLRVWAKAKNSIVFVLFLWVVAAVILGALWGMAD